MIVDIYEGYDINGESSHYIIKNDIEVKDMDEAFEICLKELLDGIDELNDQDRKWVYMADDGYEYHCRGDSSTVRYCVFEVVEY